MAQTALPGIIGGTWVRDVSKAMVGLPEWAVAFNEGRLTQGQGAFTLSPWANRCISIRMNALSKVPWEIQQNGVPLPDSELEDTFKDSKLTQLLRYSEADLCLYGKAFWEKGYAGNHMVGLRRLAASTMSMRKTAYGIEWFEQSLQRGGPTVRFSPEEIFYIHEFDPLDDLDGVAPVKVAEQAIQSEYNADRYISAFFRNNAVPAVIFSTEADMLPADSERLQSRFQQLFKGVANQFRSAFWGKGLKPYPIGFSPDKLALAEVRLEARRSICAVFGVPPTVANAADPGSYATADEQRQSLYEELIIPRAQWWAEAINDQIVSHYRSDMELVFKVDDLQTVQADENLRAERLSGLVQAGIITEQTAGKELGYSEEEIGKGRQEAPAFPGFGGGGFGQPAPKPAGNIVGGTNQPSAPKLGIPGRVVASTRKAEEPEDSGSLLEDLRLWRRKATKRVKEGKGAAVEFQSAAIQPALANAILGQLDACKTADEVRAAFDGIERDIPGRRIPREDDMQVHVHLHEGFIRLPETMKVETTAPNVTVNVEPTPIEITATASPPAIIVKAEARVPDINIENKVDLKDAAKALQGGPKLVGRSEVHRLDKKNGETVGSAAEVTYHYED